MALEYSSVLITMSVGGIFDERLSAQENLLLACLHWKDLDKVYQGGMPAVPLA